MGDAHAQCDSDEDPLVLESLVKAAEIDAARCAAQEVTVKWEAAGEDIDGWDEFKDVKVPYDVKVKSEPVGYDGDGWDDDLMNQSNPLDSSLKDFIDFTSDAELPTYDVPEDHALEKAEKRLEKENKRKRSARREEKKELIRGELRVELKEEFERKLEAAKAEISAKYEAKLALYQQRYKLKKTLEISSSEDDTDDEIDPALLDGPV